MSGSDLIALMLISMGWLFYLLGLWFRLQVLTGVVGSVTAFFTVAYLQPPWHWLWILLPLAIDPYWLRQLFRKP